MGVRLPQAPAGPSGPLASAPAGATAGRPCGPAARATVEQASEASPPAALPPQGRRPARSGYGGAVNSREAKGTDGPAENKKLKHTTTLRRFGTLEPTGRGVRIAAMHPAWRAGNSIFPSRVFDPDEVARVLKDGHQSRKIGKQVNKGRLKGAPIFTLTLEERASCPRSCGEWGSCYGNNMQAAERIVHGPELIAALTLELRELAAAHPAGFLVRLHVLGDFWSVDYVRFWQAMLVAYPALHVFGFTAHERAGEIGQAIAGASRELGWHRFAIRFSGGAGSARAARVIAPGESDPAAVLCPAQTGATECCATCALCWQSECSLAFRRH